MVQNRATTLRAAHSRRAFLAGAAANALLIGASNWSAQARDGGLERFLQLSEKLTAHRNLSRETARFYFRSVVADPQWERTPRKEGRASLESRIVADWYSGQTITPEGVICVDYTGALLWRAIGYARPAGVADAEPGRWALPPA